MVSVVIPVYNSSKTILDCLESIFNQTYQDFEVILVDDGSTDCLAYKLRIAECCWPKRVKVVHQKNQGAPSARNHGARLAKGEYLLFCDADICVLPDMFKKLLQALQHNPKASYAYSSFKFGWKAFKLWPFSAHRLKRMPYIHTSALIRTRDFTGFDESLKKFQDWDLWLTMLEHEHTGVWVDQILFHIMSTHGTMSTWLPSFFYKMPWHWFGIYPRAFSQYRTAANIIKTKHHLQGVEV